MGAPQGASNSSSSSDSDSDSSNSSSSGDSDDDSNMFDASSSGSFTSADSAMAAGPSIDGESAPHGGLENAGSITSSRRLGDSQDDVMTETDIDLFNDVTPSTWPSLSPSVRVKLLAIFEKQFPKATRSDDELRRKIQNLRLKKGRLLKIEKSIRPGYVECLLLRLLLLINDS